MADSRTEPPVFTNRSVVDSQIISMSLLHNGLETFLNPLYYFQSDLDVGTHSRLIYYKGLRGNIIDKIMVVLLSKMS